MRGDTEGMLAFIADQIRAAQASGEAHTGVDPTRAAAGLLATMEGIGVYLLNGHYTPDVALGALDTHLDVIFRQVTQGPAGRRRPGA